MEDSDVLPLNPDVVIVATGGLPNVDVTSGADHCLNTWDVLTGHASASGTVLVFDGTGRHPAPLAAEKLASQGLNVIYCSVDGQIAEELTYVERFRWKKRFLELSINPVFDTKLIAVSRANNRLQARVVNEISQQESLIDVDHVVVEQGTVPMEDVYAGLRLQSANDGVTDIKALLSMRPQPKLKDGGFELHRIGDAVSSRNIHSAMLDAHRICSVL
jgi:hypothetical protein